MSSQKSLQHIKTQQNGLNNAVPCISMPVQCSRSMILQWWYIRFYVLDRLPTLTRTTCTTSNQSNKHQPQQQKNSWQQNTKSDLSLESWNPKYLEKKTVETAVQTTSPSRRRLFQVEKRSQEPTSMSTTSTFTASDVEVMGWVSCSNLINDSCESVNLYWKWGVWKGRFVAI